MSFARGRRWEPIATAACAAIAVAVIGGTLTDLGPWYQGLKEPSWKPPDSAFGLIWTVIFSLAAISGVLAWRGDRSRKGRQWSWAAVQNIVKRFEQKKVVILKGGRFEFR